MEPVLEGMGPYSVSQVHNHPGDKDMSELPLREELARLLVELHGGLDPDAPQLGGNAKIWEGQLEPADRILSLPRIAEALRVQGVVNQAVVNALNGSDEIVNLAPESR
jgi:hypothetical protein